MATGEGLPFLTSSVARWYCVRSVGGVDAKIDVPALPLRDFLWVLDGIPDGLFLVGAFLLEPEIGRLTSSMEIV